MERITVDPQVCHGKPCIRDTRIMVTMVLGLLEEGLRVETILEEYPTLTPEDMTAAIHYAKAVLENESVELTRLSPT